jgi:hypothetical protein
MVIKKHQILKLREKVESLLGSYDLSEKKMGKSSSKTIDTTTNSCQNLDHSLEDKREIKYKHEEESNNDAYKVEDHN